MTSAYVNTNVDGSAELSYQRVPIPPAAEASFWAESLQDTPETGGVDVTSEVDIAIRYCMLAYARNNAVTSQCIMLYNRESGAEEAVELQFDGSDDFAKGAHVVVYLYRLGQGDGVGVVLAYKGSTANIEDWKHNVQIVTRSNASKGVANPGLAFGNNLFENCQQTAKDRLLGEDYTGVDAEKIRKVRCHSGFLRYKRTLDEVMSNFDFANLRRTLVRWGCPTEAPDFVTWLNSGSWAWCAFVGHSLGGAMASIAASEVAVRSGRQPLLATLGSPIPGNEALAKLQNELVLPVGGLRIVNKGDAVPVLGYMGLNVAFHRYHGGRRVKLVGRWVHRLDTYHVHLRYTVPSTCLSGEQQSDDLCEVRPKMVTFKFPGGSYRPSVTANTIRFNLGNHFKMASGNTWSI